MISLRAVRPLALALALLPASFEAQAISRYSATATPCATIQATIFAEGAAIYRWIQQPDILRYGRYVADDSYCDFGEKALPSYIPSADTPSCGVLKCKRYDPRDNFFFKFRFAPQ